MAVRIPGLAQGSTGRVTLALGAIPQWLTVVVMCRCDHPSRLRTAFRNTAPLAGHAAGDRQLEGLSWLEDSHDSGAGMCVQWKENSFDTCRARKLICGIFLQLQDM